MSVFKTQTNVTPLVRAVVEAVSKSSGTFYEINEVTKGDRGSFDFGLDGKYTLKDGSSCLFSANLVLFAIREMGSWLADDWSFTRDAEYDLLEEMFEQEILPKLDIIRDGDYEVKNVKTFMGMDCPGVNCTLYRNGKRVAACVDDGSGGGMYLTWLDHKAEREVVDTLHKTMKGDLNEKELYQRRCTPEEAKLVRLLQGREMDCGSLTLEFDEELFVDELIQKYEENKALKRTCKKKLVFTLKDKPGEVWTLKAIYGIDSKAALIKRYGENLGEIINERFTASVPLNGTALV